MRFFYTATKNDGSKESGTIEAANINDATRMLLGRGLYVKKVTKSRVKFTKNFNFFFGSVSIVEKILFTKHLATMIKSGITLSESLKVIEEQTTSGKFRRIIKNISSRIKAGQKLSTALSEYPRIFDTLFINIINVGEESGTLEENLEYLSNDLEKRHELRKSIRSAALYPSIVLTAVFALLLLLAYFVLPKITDLFKTLKFEIPLSTRILLKVSYLFENYGNVIIVLAVVIPILVYIISRIKFIKPFWHFLLLKIPIVGRIIINYNLSIISRTFYILLKSGITVDRSLAIVSDTIRSKVYQKKLKFTLEEIQKGKKISEVFLTFRQSKRNPIFPLLAIKMINVGEKSGQLEESLNYLANYYEEEVDDATKNLTVTLEPILLLTVGLIVGFVAISVISPIYQVTGKFGR